jgi:CBS domain-containing protein
VGSDLRVRFPADRGRVLDARRRRAQSEGRFERKTKGCVALPTRGRLAADILAAPAITVREDTSTLEIMDIFTTRDINRVPVIDSSGKLAGIVSRADILRAQTASRE